MHAVVAPYCEMHHAAFGSDGTQLKADGSTRRDSGRSAEAQARALLCLLRFDLAVAGGRLRLQRRQKTPRGVGDLTDRAIEGGLVGLRRLVEARQLAHELQCRGLDLVLGGGGLEIEQRLDVAAHDVFLKASLCPDGAWPPIQGRSVDVKSYIEGP